MLSNIPSDQIQFVSAQMGAFFFAILYRQLSNIHRKAPSSSQSSTQPESSKRIRRSAVASNDEGQDSDDEELNVSGSRTSNLLALTVPGLLISYLCYGQLVIHIVILSLVCYLLLLFVSPRYVHIVTLIVAMLHLSWLHLDRLFYEFSVSAVDVTSAIMILVQKVTCIAFALHDGLYRSKKLDKSLSPSQQKEALDRVPSPLEYFAYVFNFQTIICGPLVFYSDFQEFLNGTKLKRSGLTEYPSATGVIIRNILVTSVVAGFFIVLTPMFPASLLTESTFGEMSFWRKIVVIYFVAVATRLKYYFAWTLGETISNISGLGFAGIDENGEAQWNLMNNIDIFGFENSLSFRDGVQCWNKTTEKWLRKTIYERVDNGNPVVMTYIVSSIWHGFHPGYYLTFLTAALFTLSARTVRRSLRTHFVGENHFFLKEYFYHFLTWASCRAAFFYMIIPFVLLDLAATIKVFAEIYFFCHVAALALLFGVPKLFQQSKTKAKSN